MVRSRGLPVTQIGWVRAPGRGRQSRSSPCTLERVQKRDQLLLLLGTEVHLEALIVEIH
jgi:hypothetical protein